MIAIATLLAIRAVYRPIEEYRGGNGDCGGHRQTRRHEGRGDHTEVIERATAARSGALFHHQPRPATPAAVAARCNLFRRACSGPPCHRVFLRPPYNSVASSSDKKTRVISCRGMLSYLLVAAGVLLLMRMLAVSSRSGVLMLAAVLAL